MLDVDLEDTINVKKNSSKKLNFRSASMLFSFIVILYVMLNEVLSFLADKGLINLNSIDEDFYSSGIILQVIFQFLFILAPPIAFLIILKIDIKKSLKIKPVDFLNMILIFFIMCFSYPIMMMLNYGYLITLKFLFGMEMEQIVPLPEDLRQLILGLIVIGIFAGVFEEILFRGVFLQGYRELGAKWSIILTGFLFGIFHFGIQRLLGTFLLGILIGFFVYRTGSLISGIFAHIVNNSITLVIVFLSRNNRTQEKELEEIMATYQNGNNYMIIYTVIIILIVLVAIFGFVSLIYTFNLNTSKTYYHQVRRKLTNKEKLSFLWLLPGLLIIGSFFCSEIINALNN